MPEIIECWKIKDGKEQYLCKGEEVIFSDIQAGVEPTNVKVLHVLKGRFDTIFVGIEFSDGTSGLVSSKYIEKKKK